jgi:hypothetical protein
LKKIWAMWRCTLAVQRFTTCVDEGDAACAHRTPPPHVQLN